jgi:heat shock protein HtpX
MGETLMSPGAMRKTIQEQIAANKRASFIYAFMLVLILGGLGAAIVAYYAPDQWYLGAAGAGAIGLIVCLVAFKSGSDIVLSISRARPANHAEDQVLDNVVEEMSIAAGIPKPKIYVIDDPSPNAFATGSDPEHGIVCVTTGILQKLNRDELQGVIAHEMSHIRNYDIRFMTVITLLAGLIPLLADVFRNMLWWGGGGRRSRDSNNSDSGNLQAIFMVIGIVLAILAPIFAVLLQLAISRKRELLADVSAAELTRYPEGLANALIKLENDPEPLATANRATQGMFIVNPLKGGLTNLFSTHPSTQERVQALMGLAGSYEGRLEQPT